MSDITFKPGMLHGPPHKTIPKYVYVDFDTECDGEDLGHLSGYVRPAVSALLLAAPALLAFARQVASECSRCNGTAVIHVTQWINDIEVSGERDCDECADVRQVICEATGEA